MAFPNSWGMNPDHCNELEYPGIGESDSVSRVIEKPDGTKVTIYAFGSAEHHALVKSAIRASLSQPWRISVRWETVGDEGVK